MSLLQHLVHGNQGLERLHFIGQNWLSIARLCASAFVSATVIRNGDAEEGTDTFMPAQKALEDL